jgi:CRISPR/Cas system-associated exonuclease Cas4 (RecB family)
MRTSPSIHLVRGNVAHLALEHLYDILPDVIADNYEDNLKIIVTELLRKYWNESKEDLAVLGMTDQELSMYYKETERMLLNYLDIILGRIHEQIEHNGMTFVEAFKKITPSREEEYLSWEYYVKGFIDVIEHWDGKVRLMDYKTSKRAKISDAYKLQLAIYALLYQDKHGKLPDEVGIYFLKHGEMTLPVNEELVKHAQFHIEQIHASTEDTDNIADFPKKVSGLCKWSTGQCDFYDYCFKDKEIPPIPPPKVYNK